MAFGGRRQWGEGVLSISPQNADVSLKSGNGRENWRKAGLFVTPTPYSFFHLVEKGTFSSGNGRGTKMGKMA